MNAAITSSASPRAAVATRKLPYAIVVGAGRAVARGCQLLDAAEKLPLALDLAADQDLQLVDEHAQRLLVVGTADSEADRARRVVEEEQVLLDEEPELLERQRRRRELAHERVVEQALPDVRALVAERLARGADYDRSTQTVFVWRYRSSASRPSSFPNPDSLKPP